MTLREIKEILNGEVLYGEEILDIKIESAFAADLLSDVLSFAKEGSLLLTGIINPQVIRTAEMLELVGIVFVRGKTPEADTINLARAKNIPLIKTNYIMFETCGRLYKNGLIGCIESVENVRRKK
jgi:predicted transcriptional regulator